MDNVDYYKNEEFRDKITFYLVKASIAVMAEASTTEHHIKRVDFAQQILHTGFVLEAYFIGVMTNATIKAHIDAGTSYDSDLEFVVNSLFTAFAGGYNEAT